jgi:hypothetical protein
MCKWFNDEFLIFTGMTYEVVPAHHMPPRHNGDISIGVRWTIALFVQEAHLTRSLRKLSAAPLRPMIGPTLYAMVDQLAKAALPVPVTL